MTEEQTNTQTAPQENGDTRMSLRQILGLFWNLIKDIVDLRKGVDKVGTIEEIKNKKSLAGANAWMLMCSIMIASLGLDRNSPAVIIGAMLISPLMSPILGIGLGIGINDRAVIRKSMVHFTVAIVIAVLISTIYFMVTPLGTFTSEIEARTEPTILDVMIAFFGGIAGIISYARKDISITLPGVAIATALMPPLCVTGYGIANMQPDIIFSSFYLFFSNTFFIVLSTYLIVRFLEFPYRRYRNKKEQRRARVYVLFFSLVAMIPSFLIMRHVVRDIQTNLKLQEFIAIEFGKDKKYLEDYLAIQSDTLNELVLKVYGSMETDGIEKKYSNVLDSLGLKNWEVTILPTSEVNLARVANLENHFDNVDKMFSAIDSLENLRTSHEKDIDKLQVKLKNAIIDTSYFNDVAEKTREKFPELDQIAIGSLNNFNIDQDSTFTINVAIVKWNNKVNPRNYINNEEKLSLYLEGLLDKKNVEIIRE